MYSTKITYHSPCYAPAKFLSNLLRFYFQAADSLWKVLSDAGELPEAVKQLEGKEPAGSQGAHVGRVGGFNPNISKHIWFHKTGYVIISNSDLRGRTSTI